MELRKWLQNHWSHEQDRNRSGTATRSRTSEPGYHSSSGSLTYNGTIVCATACLLRNWVQVQALYLCTESTASCLSRCPSFLVCILPVLFVGTGSAVLSADEGCCCKQLGSEFRQTCSLSSDTQYLITSHVWYDRVNNPTKILIMLAENKWFGYHGMDQKQVASSMAFCSNFRNSLLLIPGISWDFWEATLVDIACMIFFFSLRSTFCSP